MEEVIGQGGMGQVLKAVDTRLKRPVAIKRVLGKLAGSRKALQRFLIEAQSVAALNHFNIVQVHDYGRDQDGPFLILEYVDGVSLSQRLKDGPLELQDAVEMTTQLSAALTAAHRRGIVHRDVKPANVLLTEDGIPKLTDFGLARHESQQGENTRTGTVLGTPDFMAPEQREDSARADAFSDQWSLAATFYQMVTGESPRIINGDSLPVSVRHVVLRALKTKPSKRYPTLQEFCDELQVAASKEQTATFDVLQLKHGQCGSCGEINDTSRKFCRDCGESLEVSCLKCGENELVWERFCGHCGTNIPKDVERKLEAGKNLNSELRTLVQDYRHQEAIEKLVPWLTADHPALKSQRDWAERTNERLQRELNQLLQQRDEQLALAREYYDQARYSKALKGLSRIPDALRTEASRRFSEEVSAIKNELDELAGEIRELSSARDYDALRGKLTRFLELRPGDQNAIQMLQRLLKRVSKQTEGDVGKTTVNSSQDDSDDDYGDHEDRAHRRPSGSSSTRSSGPLLPPPSKQFLVLVTAGVAGVVAVLVILRFLETIWLPEQTIAGTRNGTPEVSASLPGEKSHIPRAVPIPGGVPTSVDPEPDALEFDLAVTAGKKLELTHTDIANRYRQIKPDAVLEPVIGLTVPDSSGEAWSAIAHKVNEDWILTIDSSDLAAEAPLSECVLRASIIINPDGNRRQIPLTLRLKFSPSTLLSEPGLIPIENLIADSGRVLIELQTQATTGTVAALQGSATEPTSAPHIEARGSRFVAVRGIFDMKQQTEELQNALSLATLQEAALKVQAWDFELQRQTAVAGSNPWPNEWEDVDTDVAVKLLERLEFDLDVVDEQYRDAVFTMPLPYRVTGSWSTAAGPNGILASHPQIKRLLNEREQLAQDILIETMAKSAKTNGKLDETKRQGFTGIQFDTRSIGVDTTPDLLLFRFFDFSVVPRNAYRYRVRLKLLNPNFDRDPEKLQDFASREGKYRFTPWSGISTPAMTQDENEIYVAKIGAGRGVSIDAYQWMSETGSYVYGPFEGLDRGDRIASWTREVKSRRRGGETEITGGLTTEVLRPSAGTFMDEQIDFVTPNTLVDYNRETLLDPNEHPDLELATKKIPNSFQEVVVVNRFGELVRLDTVSNAAAHEAAKSRMTQQDTLWARASAH
ncbi:MAG: serine/threonine protein kinase [Planctomycetaceae bacterium]